MPSQSEIGVSPAVPPEDSLLSGTRQEPFIICTMAPVISTVLETRFIDGADTLVTLRVGTCCGGHLGTGSPSDADYVQLPSGSPAFLLGL